MIAPAHPYDPTTGTGLEWTPTRITLHWRAADGSPQQMTASHTRASPQVFWSELAFAASFPQVTHWWFGDAWTGNVRISQLVMEVDGLVRGIMQFDTTESIGLPYTIDPTTLLVDAPMPPLFVQGRNLPLRRRLAELTLAQLAVLLADERDDATIFDALSIDPLQIEPDTWYGVSSLVAAEDLPSLVGADAPWWHLPPFAPGLPWRAMFMQSLGMR